LSLVRLIKNRQLKATWRVLLLCFYFGKIRVNVKWFLRFFGNQQGLRPMFYCGKIKIPMKLAESKNDFYTNKAKQENYPSRSVYKLKEINEKFRVFKKEDIVLDLGCAPGGWLLYTAQKIGHKGTVIGMDLNDLKIDLPKNSHFIKASIKSFDFARVFGQSFDAVVSDLSPKLSGVKEIDAQNSFLLCLDALKIAVDVLKEKGFFVCKAFENETATQLVSEAKKYFSIVKKFKPAPSKASKEFYLIGVKKLD